MKKGLDLSLLRSKEKEGDDRGLNKWAIVFTPSFYGPVEVILLG